MKFFTIFKTNTGEIVQSGFCLDDDFENQNIFEDCSIIEAISDPLLHYVANNEIQTFPKKPNNLSIFNFDTKQWENPSIDIGWISVRSQRNSFLSSSDWTQIQDVPLTNKEEWVSYRQALRDITNQTDPFNIQWPTPPQG